MWLSNECCFFQIVEVSARYNETTNPLNTWRLAMAAFLTEYMACEEVTWVLHTAFSKLSSKGWNLLHWKEEFLVGMTALGEIIWEKFSYASSFDDQLKDSLDWKFCESVSKFSKAVKLYQ